MPAGAAVLVGILGDDACAVGPAERPAATAVVAAHVGSIGVAVENALVIDAALALSAA